MNSHVVSKNCIKFVKVPGHILTINILASTLQLWYHYLSENVPNNSVFHMTI